MEKVIPLAGFAHPEKDHISNSFNWSSLTGAQFLGETEQLLSCLEGHTLSLSKGSGTLQSDSTTFVGC